MLEHDLPGRSSDQLAALLAALSAAPSPPTAVVDPRDAVDRHVADSLSGLAVGPLSEAGLVADLGAGAGFPGLALAVALPAAEIDLVESTGRKVDLIAALAEGAGIANARALAVRAEDWGADEGRGRYDVVTARALAPLAVLAEYAAPLLAEGGHLVAWKGRPDPEEVVQGERAAAALGLTPLAPHAVRPFPGAERRSLHVYRKDAPTPQRFPRRPGIAVKRPLGGGRTPTGPR